MTNKTHIVGEYETASDLTIKIKMPSTRYLDKFIKRWRSAVDLLLTGYFPDAKEITESMGMLYFASKFVDFNQEDVIHYVLGDGVYPRTASMSAFSTKWKNVSIDPVMKIETPEIKHHPLNGDTKSIKNVRTIKCGCEQYKFDEQDSGQTAVISVVHCHASTEQLVLFIKEIYKHFERIVLINMPCCVKHDLESIYGPPIHQLYDMNVFSPHRMIYGYLIK